MPAWLPDAPWYVLAALPLVVFAAYTMFGATGFGSSIIAVPARAHFFSLTFAVPLVAALDCVATTNARWRQWRHADFGEFRHLLPAVLAGIAGGTTLLVNLPRAPALLVLGVFVAGHGLYLVAGERAWKAMHAFWAWPLGLVGGVVSVLFGTGGPIYMVYLSARIHDKTVLRATSSVLIRTTVFIVTGLVTQTPVLVAAAVLFPFMVGGFILGNRLHYALSRSGVMRLLAGLLVANGVPLVLRAMQILRGE